MSKKPFHESVIDDIRTRLDTLVDLRPPDLPEYQEAKEKLAEKINQELSATFKLIRNTVIPQEKLAKFIADLEEIRDSDNIRVLEIDGFEIEPITSGFEGAIKDLKERQ